MGENSCKSTYMIMREPWLSRLVKQLDTSAGTGKLCILGHSGLVFIWSCFVSCLLFLLFYVSVRNLCSGTCRKIQTISFEFYLIHGYDSFLQHLNWSNLFIENSERQTDKTTFLELAKVNSSAINFAFSHIASF